jgi:hypothetical protein
VIRPEVVRGLVDELAAPGECSVFLGATSEEKREAAGILARAAIERAQATPTVLDLTCQRLAALAATWAVVSKWSVSMQPDRRLSDCLKVMPAEHVAAVGAALVFGGFARVVSDDSDEGTPTP